MENLRNSLYGFFSSPRRRETKGKLVWAEVGSDPKEERKEGRGKYGNGVLEGSARSPLVLLLLLHVY